MLPGSGWRGCCRGTGCRRLPDLPELGESPSEEPWLFKRPLYGIQRLHKVNLTDGQIWPVMLEGAHTDLFFFFLGGKPARHVVKNTL